MLNAVGNQCEFSMPATISRSATQHSPLLNVPEKSNSTNNKYIGILLTNVGETYSNKFIGRL